MKLKIIYAAWILVFIFCYACESNLNKPSNIKAGTSAVQSGWPVLKTYEGKYLDKVAMPLGGIGTGTVSIGGRGDLRDWELENRGAIGWSPAFKLVEPTIANAPFFALYYKKAGESRGEIKLLEGPVAEDKYDGDWGCDVFNAGFPRFEETEFKAAYPMAQVLFKHPDVPLVVKLEAFNPFIPGDVDNSSLPVAILRYIVKNPTKESITVSICGMIPNFIGVDGWGGSPDENENQYRHGKKVNGLYMYSNGVDTSSVNWGNMALTTTSDSGITFRRSWAKLAWNWNFREFIDDFSEDGELNDYGFEEDSGSVATRNSLRNKDRYALSTPPATLAVKKIIQPGEEKSFVFLITWHFPNRRGWDHGLNRYSSFGTSEIVGNYYTTKQPDAWKVAEYVSGNLNNLENKTLRFVKLFCESDVPDVLKEAALFNTTNFRCQTVFRTEDGYPFGFEGTGSISGTKIGMDRSAGWGFGTCTHVWNYESAVPFLFGDLAMKFRRIEFMFATDSNGAMSSRVGLPLYEKARSFKEWAADGQMGTIIKVYRDWQLSGNDQDLREMWPKIKKAMSFAWTGIWDPNKDGVMEGPQHNTMDIEYYGPNPQMSGWYLGALHASEEMADYLNDTAFASECHNLYEHGRKWVDQNLFNGEYYEQIIPEGYSKVAQLGKGCLVDQLVGQYLSHTAGLGYILDSSHVATTLQSIMKYNYVTNFNNQINTFRSFALNHELGLIMASYPHGDLLDFPFPYYTEVMSGFEYSTAANMIYEGQIEAGLKVYKAIRERYDGYKRNPFDELEYGHRYARAMASWAGIIAYTGFHYSAVQKSMTFNSRPGKYFWSNGYQFGSVEIGEGKTKKTVIMTLGTGSLELNEFTLQGFGSLNLEHRVFKEGENAEFEVVANDKMAGMPQNARLK